MAINPGDSIWTQLYRLALPWSLRFNKGHRKLQIIIEELANSGCLVSQIKRGAKKLNETLNPQGRKYQDRIQWFDDEHSVCRESIRNFELPGVSKFILWCEKITVWYLLYLVTRNLLPVDSIVRFMSLSKSYNCYVAGRGVLSISTQKPVFTFICFTHIIWRIRQRVREPRVSNLYLFLYQHPNTIEAHRRKFHNRNVFYNNAKLRDDDLILRYLMCYPVRLTGKTIYHLRPNRSHESHKLLIRHAFKAFDLLRKNTFLVACLIGLACAHEIIFDERYLLAYPGCSPELEERLQRGEPRPSYTITFTWHRIFALIFDTIENTIAWHEGSVHLMDCAVFSYLINHDILIYWYHINERIRKLHARIVKLWLKHGGIDAPISERVDKIMTKLRAPKNLIPKADCETENSSAVDEFLMLETSIYDLQVEISDFFEHFEQSDAIMGDIITTAFIMWVAVFVLLTYLALALNIATGVFLSICEVVAMIMIGALNIILWKIHRNIIRSYVTICSLIAHDQSRYKLKYLKVLEYYTVRKRYAYKILHTYPACPQVFLKFCAWTLSCLVVIESLFSKRK